MRGFFISSMLFLLLLAGGILNFFFIHDVCDEMNHMISEISETPSNENEEKIKQLDKYWKKVESRVSISVSYMAVDEIGKLIDAIETYNRQEDGTQLPYYIALLKNATENVRHLEQFSVKNIL